MKLINMGAGLEHIIDIENINENSVMIDAGSNIGKFIEKIREGLKLNCKIYAIEPSIKNIGFIEENNFSNVSIIQKALVGDNQQDCVLTEFVGEKKQDGTNRYHQWNNVLGNHKHKMKDRNDVELIEYQVETMTIEDIFKIDGIDEIDYFKMDIEGSEYEVIDSLTQELATKIKQISMELHDNSKNAALEQKLKDLGYSTKVFEHNELYAYRRSTDK